MNTPPDSAANSLVNQGTQYPGSSYQQPRMGDSRRSSGSPRDGPSAASSASSAIAVAADINEEEMYAGFQPAGSSASGPSPPASLTGSDPRQQSLAGTRITAEDSAFIDEDWDPDMTRYPESMSSSIRAHVYEGHLRYHAFREGKYAFPNDDVEQNRDDMKHAMTVMLMRGDYHYAPVADRLRDDGTVYDLGMSLLSFWNPSQLRLQTIAKRHTSPAACSSRDLSCRISHCGKEAGVAGLGDSVRSKPFIVNTRSGG